MTDLEEEREYYYDEDAWKLYYKSLKVNKRGRIRSRHDFDYGAFLPDPDEVQRRASDVRWLYDQGFNPFFIQSVMVENDPPIEEVVYLREVRGFSIKHIQNILWPEDD